VTCVFNVLCTSVGTCEFSVGLCTSVGLCEFNVTCVFNVSYALVWAHVSYINSTY
jgi:hypothetical protein